MRSSRIAAAAAALLLSIAAFAGCAASSGEVSLTPAPMFASDEEAFAAAEATYRAYVDAGQSSTDSGIAADRFLIGPALEAHLTSQRDFESRGVHIEGNGQVFDFRGVSIDSARSLIKATLCFDVSTSRVLSESGLDVTPLDRPQVVPVGVTFVANRSTLLISESLGFPEGVMCE